MVTKKKNSKPKAKKGDALECNVCGIRLIVDEACGCIEYQEIICCGSPLKKKSPAKKKTATKKKK